MKFCFIIIIFFYNNLGIRAVILYFCFALIGLINDYKNIYSHNVCIKVFIKIVSIMVFHTNCQYDGFSYKLLVCDGFSFELLLCNGLYVMVFHTNCQYAMIFHTNCQYLMVFIQIVSMQWFFKQIVSFKIIFSIKTVMCMFGGRGGRGDGHVNMCEFCRYIVAFKIIFSMKRGYVYLWGTCKNALVLRVCYFEI